MIKLPPFSGLRVVALLESIGTNAFDKRVATCASYIAPADPFPYRSIKNLAVGSYEKFFEMLM